MDRRDALLDSFLAKRESLQRDAQRHRAARDEHNERTRAHAQRRDELNGKVRAVVDRANQHRTRRDELNHQVRAAKAERDRLNRDAQEKAARLHELRQARGGPAAAGGAPVPLSRLKAELRHLETIQQTTVMTPKKEKEVIEQIAAKLKEIKARESVVEDDAELREAVEALRAVKAQAEEQHAALTRHAQEAQEEHEKMSALFTEADALRKEADAAQAEFVRSKVESDRLHRLHIDAVLASKDLDRVIHALRAHGTPAQGQPHVPASAQAHAEEIFDRFRKGEKLSTEDLMALQKAGRL